MAYIDRVFKGYAIDAFGDRFTDAEIEEARTYAFRACSDLIEKTRCRAPKGTVEKFFIARLTEIAADREEVK